MNSERYVRSSSGPTRTTAMSAVLEVTLSFSERATVKVKCPKCGNRKVTPQLTGFTAKTSRKS